MGLFYSLIFCATLIFSNTFGASLYPVGNLLLNVSHSDFEAIAEREIKYKTGSKDSVFKYLRKGLEPPKIDKNSTNLASTNYQVSLVHSNSSVNGAVEAESISSVQRASHDSFANSHVLSRNNLRDASQRNYLLYHCNQLNWYQCCYTPVMVSNCLMSFPSVNFILPGTHIIFPKGNSANNNQILELLDPFKISGKAFYYCNTLNLALKMGFLESLLRNNQPIYEAILAIEVRFLTFQGLFQFIITFKNTALNYLDMIAPEIQAKVFFQQ